MRKFLVTVNGTKYEVEVEELGEGTSAAQVSAPAAPAPAKKPAAAAGSTPVLAPMPGTVLKLPVSVGSEVKKGQLLCVLEAMKMENEIVAPCDGKIVTLGVKQGDTVATSDLLAAIG